MNEHAHDGESTRWFEWKAAVIGCILGIILTLIWLLGGWGSVTVDGEDVSAQASAALLASEVDADGDTLAVRESTDADGNTVIGLWVGEAPTSVVRITPAPEGEGDEGSEPTPPPVNPSGESIKGPWDNPWWRGSDRPGFDDPTPGVTKMYAIPIQGVGGGGGGSSSGGDGGGDGPGQEF